MNRVTSVLQGKDEERGQARCQATARAADRMLAPAGSLLHALLPHPCPCLSFTHRSTVIGAPWKEVSTMPLRSEASRRTSWLGMTW